MRGCGLPFAAGVSMPTFDVKDAILPMVLSSRVRVAGCCVRRRAFAAPTRRMVHVPCQPAPITFGRDRRVVATRVRIRGPMSKPQALAWMINRAAATYDLSFRPGPDGNRPTDFAEGKRFVRLKLVQLIKY